MTTVQTICTVPFNAVLPSTPANWLYLESDCDGLSSDQVQTYIILTHLIWTTDEILILYYIFICNIIYIHIIRRWFGEKPSARITEKTNCIYEISVAQNMTDIFGIPRDGTLSQIVMVFVPPDPIWTTDVNVTRYRSCSKSQEVLDQAWRDSVPGKSSCQFFYLNNLNRWFGENPSATIARSLCIVELIRKRCLSVLIDI